MGEERHPPEGAPAAAADDRGLVDPDDDREPQSPGISVEKTDDDFRAPLQSPSASAAAMVDGVDGQQLLRRRRRPECGDGEGVPPPSSPAAIRPKTNEKDRGSPSDGLAPLSPVDGRRPPEREERRLGPEPTPRRRSRKVLLLRRILLALLASVATVLTYHDPSVSPSTIQFVYDDAGSVSQNVVVNGNRPWREAFTRDFWGTPLSEPASHKSFRPITTLSFRLNWIWNDRRGKAGTAEGFRAVQLALHGINTFLVTTLCSRYVFDGGTWFDDVSSLVTGLLFGIHPVHAEAVSNMTSRGELLMALFFLCAFWSYAGRIPSFRRGQTPEDQGYRGARYALRVYVLPWACMFFSTFSKEQGATTLIGCVVYDFFENAGSVRDLMEALFSKKTAEKGNGRDAAKTEKEGPNDPNVDPSDSTKHVPANNEEKKDQESDGKVSAGGAKSELTEEVLEPLLQNESKKEKGQPVCASEAAERAHDELGGNTATESANAAAETTAEQQPAMENGAGSTSTHSHSETKAEAEERSYEERRRSAALGLLRRTLLLAVQTLLVCALRVRLNGASSPDFNYDQNPAAFSEDRFTRIFSVCWVWCLYLYDAAYPKYLSCDWSGRSIPLIETWGDARIVWVVTLWLTLASCVYFVVFPLRPTTTVLSSSSVMALVEGRRIALMAVFGFLVSPFLMSCNLLVRVGLMKGDRVMYLPLLGLCVLEALAFKFLFCERPEVQGAAGGDDGGATAHPMRWGKGYSVLGIKSTGQLLLLARLTFFFTTTRERNLAWTTNLRLWKSAYMVNPRSKHTMYNCGYQLALAKKYKAAEKVLRPIRHPVTGDSPATTFVYALALQNLGRCEEAKPLIDDALEVVRRDTQDETKAHERLHTKERERYDQARRAESNLLTAKGLCSQDNVPLMGKLFYDAVQVDPNNEYAVNMANNLVQMLERQGVNLNQPQPQLAQQMQQRMAMQQQAQGQMKQHKRRGVGGVGSQ